MALRVLLADESVTIKKVFQLSLQDFAVEVTPVTMGLDVVQVAAKIKPDIIFADVLLQKKSGYDVCQELKLNPELASIPVVLIWSGFMELDEKRFKESGANAHLEKPFDAQKLRQIVTKFVPKTKEQKLSQYLTFPNLPEFIEDSHVQPAEPPPRPAAPPPPTQSIGSWSMDSFEQIEHTHIPPIPSEEPTPTKEEDAEETQWVQKNLANYKLDPKKIKEEASVVKYKIPQEKIDPDTFVSNTFSGLPPPPPVTQKKSDVVKHAEEYDEEEEEEFFELDLGDEKLPDATLDSTLEPVPPPLPLISEKQLEAAVREQAKEMIEKVIWQVVPEIATQIIERELARLLKERSQK
ncbi:MAG: hypothetical protein A2Z20_04595 [Bdellovibrionales bacterium RBG_16_40_8]|nr:MAG: hypothetical protein A2Z20_04595 [Bdellovibrionales bacterium RBG_16_40_8]